MPSKALESIVDSIFGYDFSFRIRTLTASSIPAAQDRLEEAGFKVFLDQADYTAGMDRVGNEQAGAKEPQTVIVGRSGALASEWVRREVEVAWPTTRRGHHQYQRRRAGSAGQFTPCRHGRRQSLAAPGRDACRPRGPPSDHAVAELIDPFRATRQETKRQRIVATAAGIFAVAAAVALWQALEADWHGRSPSTTSAGGPAGIVATKNRRSRGRASSGP